ncbi:hypothetical protein ACR777_16650 [Sphingobacterium spiritivorum]|uniref:hypothetical protein n=1 Tax=Sphingobacterium spiritivorum TaxID=258 RepID=UPI003DA49FC3
MIQQITPHNRSMAILRIYKGILSLITGLLLLNPNETSAQVTFAEDMLQHHQIPLHTFQGFYQLPNKVAFISFEQQDDSLYATQLWDQKKYQLIRTGETSFASKNEGYTIAFLKDSMGNFTQAKILGRIVCQRILFNPSKVVKLSLSQLNTLAGTYLMANDNNLKIKIEPSEQGLLLTQLWDNKTIAFTPRSEFFFLNEDATFPLTFSFANGKVKQMQCFENDLWLKAD